jgi:hypothetical protein
MEKWDGEEEEREDRGGRKTGRRRMTEYEMN